MGRDARWVWMLFLVAWLGLGCGSGFEAGNKLKVTKAADKAGSTAPVFLAVEQRDDSGRDGQAGTHDEGESDGFPDPEEAIVTLLSNDIGVLSLENEPRLGVGDTGVELQVFRIDVTYFDANGNTPAFAPKQTLATSLTIPNRGTADLEFDLVPLAMKRDQGGLRDIFLFGSEAEVRAVSKMTAVVDVFAKDARNNDTVHAQGQVNLVFINPMTTVRTQ